MLGAFAGIMTLSLARPESEEDMNPDKIAYMTPFEKKYAYQIGLILAILTSAMSSVISVAARRLKTLHFAVIQFSYGVMSTVAMAIYLMIGCIQARRVPYAYDSWWPYFEIIVSAFFNMVAQSLMTYSNQKNNPGTVGLIAYMGVTYNFIFDLCIFNIKFNNKQIIGVFTTLICSITAAIYKIKIQKQQKVEAEKGENKKACKVEKE